jgi:glycosyltransferase involved in cell wall biosynthesis
MTTAQHKFTAAQHRVSVIVPTCDRPALLRQALSSIRAIEGLDLTFEILVCDNGSAAETPAIAEEFGAIYLKAPTHGPSAARNVGLRTATGEYIAFLDDDDVWLPENVRPHITHLGLNPALDAVIGQAVYSDPNLVPIGPPWPEEAPRDSKQLLRRMLSGFFPQIGTVLARTAVRNTIGEFDETLIGGEDLDWLLRLARRNCLGFIPTPCLLFRLRPAGSYDAIQRNRIAFDRRVFLRHALPEWRIWTSPLDFSRAYSGTLWHFYQYFVDAAVERAARGESYNSFRAIAIAFGIFPLRAVYHLIAPRPLRKAFWTAILHRRRERPRRSNLQ